ncbi:hypothetical protein ALC57_02323 [Trachymyrmex cornetzi]|uniref:Uncharacterized protein n=1 Tax=Trachymyrmex cornetzi TaxID=471704 RepID=A0A195EK19_9HYME|nr:hypothetical protein ALC57_02323 [Trachymyrmex cornetzi]
MSVAARPKANSAFAEPVYIYPIIFRRTLQDVRAS